MSADDEVAYYTSVSLPHTVSCSPVGNSNVVSDARDDAWRPISAARGTSDSPKDGLQPVASTSLCASIPVVGAHSPPQGSVVTGPGHVSPVRPPDISSSANGGSLTGVRVLYVDDEAVNRGVARRMLQRLGCACEVLSVRAARRCKPATAASAARHGVPGATEPLVFWWGTRPHAMTTT